MKKFKKSVLLLPLLSLMVFDGFASNISSKNDDYTLEQMVVFSRHGIRAPLITPSNITTHQWPKNEAKTGYLTLKGAVLESYLGNYFHDWLVDNKLLQENNCPTEKDISFYANSYQRTIATAQFFTAGAFPGCIVPVTHRYELNKMDPLFAHSIKKGSGNEFIEKAKLSISQTAGKDGIDGLNKELEPIYRYVETILDYKNAPICKTDKQCDITAKPASIEIIEGKNPAITGTMLDVAYLSDAFLLEYYNGTPMDKIVWGQVKSEQNFNDLVLIKEVFNSTMYSAPVVANHVSENLINYISDKFNHPENAAKIDYLVGHDINVIGLLATLKVKPYELEGQYEKTPIGGKLFFERWKDNKTGKELFKLEYVYQTSEQITNMEVLSRENPPQRTTLVLEGCPADKNGFCDFDVFKNYMNTIYSK